MIYIFYYIDFLLIKYYFIKIYFFLAHTHIYTHARENFHEKIYIFMNGTYLLDTQSVRGYMLNIFNL